MGLQAKKFGAKPRKVLPEAGPAPKKIRKKSRVCPTLVAGGKEELKQTKQTYKSLHRNSNRNIDNLKE
jgi:hypothetical protein